MGLVGSFQGVNTRPTSELSSLRSWSLRSWSSVSSFFFLLEILGILYSAVFALFLLVDMSKGVK